MHTNFLTLRFCYYCCWSTVLSYSGTRSQTTALHETDGAVCKIVEQLENGDYATQKEACWALSNLATGGSQQCAALLVDEGAVGALCRFLTTKDTNLLIAIIEVNLSCYCYK
jgi:Armadillo/beta-catenin-like repeat